MVATFHAELTVARASMAPGIVDPLVREGARRAGFLSQEVETLVAAVEQAATAIMQRAFAPHEPGTLRFTSDLTPVSWTLALWLIVAGLAPSALAAGCTELRHA